MCEFWHVGGPHSPFKQEALFADSCIQTEPMFSLQEGAVIITVPRAVLGPHEAIYKLIDRFEMPDKPFGQGWRGVLVRLDGQPVSE